jgi:acetyltransferase-like isoleucine patch superfamily enzyme
MNLFPLLTLFLPPSKLKNKILNLFPSKNIHNNSYIGFSYINVKHLTVAENVRIKHLVKMKGLESVVLKKNSFIGNHNSFYCNATLGDNGHFILGVDSELVRQNALDLTCNITIGDNVVIGGFGSQFWTHGFDVYRNRIEGEIVIANNVYIGSSTVFNLGITICDDVIVGAGSLVSRNIKQTGFYAGSPISKKADYCELSASNRTSLKCEIFGRKFYVKELDLE